MIGMFGKRKTRNSVLCTRLIIDVVDDDDDDDDDVVKTESLQVKFYNTKILGDKFCVRM